MKMRFTGQHNNGQTQIIYLGCTFEGHDAREVSAEVAALLDGHPEFEVIAEAVVLPAKPVPAKRRRKVAR